MKALVLFLFIVSAGFVNGQSIGEELKIVEGLSVVQLTPNVYQHISDLKTETFGNVKCNGLIYINGNEAIICDTPATGPLSAELLNWLEKNHSTVKIKAIVVNHFHADCLAGLREFHQAGIKSYAHQLGPELMKIKKVGGEAPQEVFSESLELKVGNGKIVNYYFGEAHTRDNIITWIPSENTIFGGCMVKSMDASKGNLEDANVKAWPGTIRKIKASCPSAKIVIPGHGDVGGLELLDYTIRLFETE